MKYLIAFFCIAGIAITSAAPFAADSIAEQIAPEDRQERAIEVPQVAPGGNVEEKAAPSENVEEKAAPSENVEEKAAPSENVAERAAETPEETDAPSAFVGERSADNLGGVQERAIIPSYREVIDAIETKYLTGDGRALLKSIIPFA